MSGENKMDIRDPVALAREIRLLKEKILALEERSAFKIDLMYANKKIRELERQIKQNSDDAHSECNSMDKNIDYAIDQAELVEKRINFRNC